MATIDEDRSLEQLFFTTSLSCDAARNRRCAIKSRKEEWQRNCLEKRSIREMSSWIIYGFRALVKKLGFHCKWCKSARSIPFKIEPYIISWNDYYAISIYISSFKAINRHFFSPLISLLVIHLHLSQLKKYHFTSNVIPPKRSNQERFCTNLLILKTTRR